MASRPRQNDQPLPPTNPAPATGRASRPRGYNPYVGGGLEIIARRLDVRSGIITPGIGSRVALGAAAYQNPMRVLAMLGDIHPMVAKAQRNILSLTCAPDDVKLKAVDVSKRDLAIKAGRSDEATDAEGTEALESFFANLPQEIGGLKGLRKTLTLMVLYAGLQAVECVPAATGQGLAQVWPVDPLTVQFRRSATDAGAPLEAWQEQTTGPKVMPADFFLWFASDATVDNPYGRATYAAVLPDALANMAFKQDMRDAVHNSAWKRLVIKYSLEALYKTATDLLELQESSTDSNGNVTYPAQEWVLSQIRIINQYLSDLKPDDNVAVDSSGSGGMDAIEGANLQGLQPVIESERLSLIQALGETPTMMGVEGASFNFGSVAWSTQAQSYTDIRDDVLGTIQRIGNLHLRMLGKMLKCEIETLPIRTTDTLIEAQTRVTQIQNEIELVDRGYQSDETAAMALTGSGVYDPAQAAAQKAASIAAAAPMPAKVSDSDSNDGGGHGEDTRDLGPGTTKEERDAQQSAAGNAKSPPLTMTYKNGAWEPTGNA
jgi:hypothetical protein